MIATTHGTGPFQPAISFLGRLWLSPVLYDDEETAVLSAQITLDRMLARATEAINRDQFFPTEIKR